MRNSFLIEERIYEEYAFADHDGDMARSVPTYLSNENGRHTSPNIYGPRYQLPSVPQKD